MKKRFLVILLVVVLCVSLTACFDKKPVQVDENSVIITAIDSKYSVDNKTLKEYMDVLQSANELTYEIKDGMIVALNGKANTTNSYWMLYTSDTEHANSEWGTAEYDGNVYGSATLGATELLIKDGYIYIWVYQTF